MGALDFTLDLLTSLWSASGKKKMEVPESVNIIDLKTLTWSMGPSITQARDDFASAFDEQTGRLYIFGGFNKS